MLHVYELESVDCFGSDGFLSSESFFKNSKFEIFFVHESEEQVARFTSDFVGFQCPHWKHSCLSGLFSRLARILRMCTFSFVSVAPESAITTVHRSLQEVNFLGEHSPWKVVWWFVARMSSHSSDIDRECLISSPSTSCRLSVILRAANSLRVSAAWILFAVRLGSVTLAHRCVSGSRFLCGFNITGLASTGWLFSVSTFRHSVRRSPSLPRFRHGWKHQALLTTIALLDDRVSSLSLLMKQMLHPRCERE